MLGWMGGKPDAINQVPTTLGKFTAYWAAWVVAEKGAVAPRFIVGDAINLVATVVRAFPCTVGATLAVALLRMRWITL